MPARDKSYYVAYRAKNRERLRIYAREWARAHRPQGQLTPSEAKQGPRNPMWKGGKDSPSKQPGYLKEWRKKNEDYIRDKEYKKRFRASLKEYDRLLAKQEGVCAICCCVPSRRRLDMDHCHDTGKVRGLLCDTCNRAIGLFDDNPELLRQAARYLENASTK